MGDDRMDQGLDKAIGKFEEAIKELDLPSDGKERTVSITVGGNNRGNIILGHQITVNTPPQEKPPRPLTEQEMRDKERYAKQQRFNALTRSFINLPNALLLLFIASVIAMLFSGQLWQLVSAVPANWGMLVPLSVAVVMLPLAGWSFRIRKLEQGVIREAQDTLDTIRKIRHRRRVG